MSAKTTAKSERESPSKAKKQATEHDTIEGASAKLEDSTPGKSARSKPAPAARDQGADETKKTSQPESQLRELEERYLRLRAEYDNHIKRTNKEKSE